MSAQFIEESDKVVFLDFSYEIPERVVEIISKTLEERERMLKLFIVLYALLASSLAMTGNLNEAFFKQLLSRSHSKSHPETSQLMVSNNVGSSTSCEIELHVTETIKGQCIQLGSTRDRGCIAGMYFEPFHEQCLGN